MALIKGNDNANTLSGTTSNDTIYGYGGNDSLLGNNGNDLIYGGNGNDIINGGSGLDTMVGGTGNDTYYVDNSRDAVTEYSNEGNDSVYSSISYTLPANIENLYLTGSGQSGYGNSLDNTITGNAVSNILYGNSGNDTIYGGSGNDSIDGGTGTDIMYGGTSNDIYYVDNSQDQVIENPNEGTDIVYSSTSYSLGSNVENLILTGSESINGTGNNLNNTIIGNSGNNILSGNTGNDSLSGGMGNDILDGGAGNDTMIGGTGNDIYNIDSTGDKITENTNEGNDTVNSAITYTLGNNLENLVLTGTSNINGTGNSLANSITGNIGDNVLNGLGGNDTLNGGIGNDTYTVSMSAGQDLITDSQGNDKIIFDRTDVTDTTLTFTKDNNDLVIKLTASTDTLRIQSWFSDNNYKIEQLQLKNGTILTSAYIDSLFTDNVPIIGDDNDNILSGDALNNTIDGKGGNDILYGYEGNDTLIGGAGNDTLIGGLGIDSMSGGTGNDTYTIDSQDVITESLNEGTDSVNADFSYTLIDNFENLVLTGTANINGTGNDLNNAIAGNSGDNILTGGAGADTLTGGTGNDTYIIDSQDIISEASSGGTDTVNVNFTYTLPDNFENLVLIGASNINGTGNDLNNAITGNSGNNALYGYAGNDILTGNAGNDTLDGGTGIDSMTGGSGNDTYYVDNSSDQAVEDLNNGADTVYSSISYSLGSNLENLTLTGTNNIYAIANNLDNTITGNAGNNFLYGGDGNDTYNTGINWGNDTIQDNSGNDQIIFGQGIVKDNLIFQKSGNDLIIDHNDTDFMTIKGWYISGQYQIEKLVFSNGTTLTPDDIEKIITGAKYISGTENDDTLTGTIGNDTIDGKSGNDTLYGGTGNDIIYGGNGNDKIYGDTGADTMYGGLGDDTYYVNDSGDKIIENSYQSPDTSFIDSPYLQDIYSRVFPRLMANQWSFTAEGILLKAGRYTTVDGNTVVDWNATNTANNYYLNILAKYFDYVVMNRAGSLTGTNGYSDLYCDNYDSLFNTDAGLNKAMNSIKAAANVLGNHIYALTYMNMTDAWNYESVNNGYNWTFWLSQQYFGGQNFGTWDYCNANNLYMRVNGKLIDYYGSSDTQRPFFDARNILWQQYATLHAKGILDAGFDGIFSDNWLRSQTVGNLNLLSASAFKALQDGWNTIGENIQALMSNQFLIGNSPADTEFTNRDVCMLEDRIDDVLGTLDRSIASYFRYTYLAEQMHQVCQDTYYLEQYGPFETFRLPICLLTDNILGLGSTTDHGTSIEILIKPLETLGDIGIPEGNKFIVTGTGTGIFDTYSDFSFERAVYERVYSNGLVFLNDTAAKVTVILPYGEWLRSDGVLFDGGSQIVLDSLRGWVFKRTDIPVLDHSDNGGNDTIYSTVNYTLPENVEKLVLTGVENLSATGNNADNILFGNNGSNELIGLGGNDTYGNYNHSYLFGNDTICDIVGNDTLDLKAFSMSEIGTNITFSAINTGDNPDNIDALLIKFITGDSVQINNYFDDTSPTASLSGQGYGLIENIAFSNGTLDFDYIHTHI